LRSGHGIWRRHEVVAGTVCPDPTKGEELAVGDNDIALAEQEIVQGDVRSDLVSLGGAWRLSLDAGRVFLGHHYRGENRITRISRSRMWLISEATRSIWKPDIGHPTPHSLAESNGQDRNDSKNDYPLRAQKKTALRRPFLNQGQLTAQAIRNDAFEDLR
jgi:hypothetical protein